LSNDVLIWREWRSEEISEEVWRDVYKELSEEKIYPVR
jgi:hypothetical protein